LTATQYVYWAPLKYTVNRAVHVSLNTNANPNPDHNPNPDVTQGNYHCLLPGLTTVEMLYLTLYIQEELSKS